MKNQIKLFIFGIFILAGLFILASLMVVSACQQEGQSCAGYSGNSQLDCCSGLDCQYFQCVDTGTCTSGQTKCGVVGNPDVSGDVYYSCVSGTYQSQGKVDGKCGYVDCGVTGQSCSLGSGCCSPYYTCDSSTNKCKSKVIGCGDGICQSDESKAICSEDCGGNFDYKIVLLIAGGVLIFGSIIFLAFRKKKRRKR